MTHPTAAAGTSPVRPLLIVAAILAYILLITGVRLGLSPFLEIDEAQFVGAVDIRLVYENSHPPLYNWLVRLALEASGGHWSVAVASVRAVLLLATYLLVFDSGRRLGGAVAGTLAVAMLAFMPQISWMSAHTLAHSILVTAAAAGIVNGLVRLSSGPNWSAYLVIGLSCVVGFLAKPNIAVLIAAALLAMLCDRFWWQRLASPWAFLVPALVAALAGPALYAMAQTAAGSTERIAKLYVEGPFAALDIPGLGIDGVLSLVLSALASAGLVLALVVLFGRRRPQLGVEAEAASRLLWRTMFIGLAIWAAGALAADVSLIHERYLSPVLMPLPVLAAVRLMAWRRWPLLAGVAALAFLAVPVGMAAMSAFDQHRFARPYDALAAQILAQTPPGRILVDASRESLAANMSLAFTRAGRPAWVAKDRHAPMTDVTVVLAPGRGDALPAPPGLCARSAATVSAPIRNVAGRPMLLRFTIAEPCAEGATAAPSSARHPARAA